MVITVTVLRVGLVVNVTMTLTSVCGVPVLLVPLVKMLKEDTAACGKTKGVNRCDGDVIMNGSLEQTTLVFELCVDMALW